MTVLARPVAATKTGLTERSIARALAVGFFARKYLVMVPNCNWTGNECDLLALDEKLRVIDVEVKISRSDLKADAEKYKWWRSEFVGYGEVREHKNHHGTVFGTSRDPIYNKTLREWPPKCWKHYYCMPSDIWSDDLLAALPSKKSGVLLITHDRHGGIEIKCRRRATPDKDAKPVSAEAAISIARLASLRMWEWQMRYDQSQARVAP